MAIIALCNSDQCIGGRFWVELLELEGFLPEQKPKECQKKVSKIMWKVGPSLGAGKMPPDSRLSNHSNFDRVDLLSSLFFPGFRYLGATGRR